MTSEIIIIVTELIFLGVNMFWPFSEIILALTSGSGQNEPESGQKHIYAREHQLYSYINTEIFGTVRKE